ncbi:DEAD/DEAH box helicase [Hydrogenovibrio sp. 3SP14C1]|uniref:DEAD/DEAH box helicase n=1 Tax=Hydrogenovibrio sp. 3SP14C1 TaxID=3038774 RepID=UPI002415E5D9|nr:DEAD/DEAH box helicase [Hydrogenovibrio sp. 3SP14C1]MDG4813132.1 DEAD/DEAH box helicase [Hydrogenovibrio sp. 3SP14C1]
MTFASLGLSKPILDAVTQQGYETPSPIQAQAIPAVLEGKDVMAAAQTGTGKTAGFTLPILERLSKGKPAGPNQARALILTPTRELAAQVSDSVETYGKQLSLKSTVVFGGVKINPQMMRLRKGVDILVATPGRLLDLFNQNAVKFDQLEILVLDEADRMLDMGFIHDIKRILKALPKNRQNLLFSATFSNEIRQLAKGLVNNPVEISVTPRNTTATTVTQWIYPVDKGRKAALLTKLIKENDWTQVLIFSRTKHGANRLTKQLEGKGIKAAAIHGNKSQGARTKALASFKDGSVQALVATDIAARGIDIDQLPHVVNFDLPNVAEDYVHRIGRTGRAGAVGEAVSLVSADEVKELAGIENLIQKLLPRKTIDGFEPSNEVPETRLNHRPKKPKKPKKPKTPHASGKDTSDNKSDAQALKKKPANRNRRPNKPKSSPHSGSPKTNH